MMPFAANYYDFSFLSEASIVPTKKIIFTSYLGKSQNLIPERGFCSVGFKDAVGQDFTLASQLEKFNVLKYPKIKREKQRNFLGKYVAKKSCHLLIGT